MKLIEFTEKDFDELYTFMQPLWLETYGEILPKAQIIFLLDKYFSTEGLTYYRAQGYRYYKIDQIGVLTIVEKTDSIYIDKLYLQPQARGKNYPSLIFTELLKGGKDITLNVNQSNARAVNCYLKNGFIIDEKTDIDLGNGMINCDYVMRKKATDTI